MIQVGLLSFSDGRQSVHQSLAPYISECEQRIKDALEATGEVTVYTAAGIIHDAQQAEAYTRSILSNRLQALILNVPIFIFPNFAAIAATLARLPVLTIAPPNGKLPGLGGLQATVNMIRQTGGACEKIWGHIADDTVRARVMVFLRAAYAAEKLKGQVYGLLGGRSIGMGTGTANPDLWLRQFGVDIEHIDQLEIIRRADQIDDEQTDKAFAWLNENLKAIQFADERSDGKLTPDSLRYQIKCYYAIKAIIAEKKLDFVGVKCHYELSAYYVTQCLSAAFFNDPYDWDGAKEPFVYACEADSDGALTMQVMKLVSGGQPVMFSDFRHYDEKDGLFTFCNCGAMATAFAGLANVTLCPVIPKYAGMGCHVQYIAKSGLATFGRLTRVMDQYKMTIFTSEVVSQPAEKLADTCPDWPHCFVKVSADPYALIDRYECNHIHGVYGDHCQALAKFCEIKGIACEIIQ